MARTSCADVVAAEWRWPPRSEPRRAPTRWPSGELCWPAESRAAPAKRAPTQRASGASSSRLEARAKQEPSLWAVFCGPALSLRCWPGARESVRQPKRLESAARFRTGRAPGRARPSARGPSTTQTDQLSTLRPSTTNSAGGHERQHRARRPAFDKRGLFGGARFVLVVSAERGG